MGTRKSKARKKAKAKEDLAKAEAAKARLKKAEAKKAAAATGTTSEDVDELGEAHYPATRAEMLVWLPWTASWTQHHRTTMRRSSYRFSQLYLVLFFSSASTASYSLTLAPESNIALLLRAIAAVLAGVTVAIANLARTVVLEEQSLLEQARLMERHVARGIRGTNPPKTETVKLWPKDTVAPSYMKGFNAARIAAGGLCLAFVVWFGMEVGQRWGPLDNETRVSLDAEEEFEELNEPGADGEATE